MLDASSSIAETMVRELQTKLAELGSSNEKVAQERDEYRRLYQEMLVRCRKLELGILGQQRERFSSDTQLSMALLGMLTAPAATPSTEPPSPPAPPPERRKPTGRKPLPPALPRVDVEILPDEVRLQGLNAFDRLGEDICETLERRPASLVVVRVHTPKFVAKGRDLRHDIEVAQAISPELPIIRGVAGPGLLADTIVKRWQDHLPLHRLERIYGREGVELARSTVCGWHQELATLAAPLIRGMWAEALLAPYLCVDATGVLVQAPNECRHGHFFVVAAPERHVLFAYSAKHDSAAVDSLLAGYKGYLVADAHAVYDHLFEQGGATESGCWSHGRRYFFKALGSDPTRARQALELIKRLFLIERSAASASPEERLRVRQAQSKPVLDTFFAWCDEQAHAVLDATPIAKAIGYARNQRLALQTFLQDGRLPIHNNFSERQLRREAVGRKNWLFLGSDEGGAVNATFVSLLASCQLHGLEPWAYLRDLLCLLPGWPTARVLELAPAYWKKTLEQEDTQQRLAANVFRQATITLK